EPLTYQEAVACEDSSKWIAPMEDEMDSLRKNKTWVLVDHPARQKLVSYKWLFKIKVFKILGTRQGWWLVDAHKGHVLIIMKYFHQ
ncbi:retrovirus-related pol polyprotein from transposon TNT 1-94, partial [Tanacetum coccineum]